MNSPKVHTENTRTGNQRELWEKIIKDGKDPFTKENITQYHPDGIFKEFKHWFVIRNQFPYDNSKYHLVVIVNREQVTDPTEMTNHEQVEIFSKIIPWIQSNEEYRGGSIVWRMGESTFSGASVAHLHFHWVQPEEGKQVKACFGMTPVNDTYRNALETILKKGKKIKPTFHEGYALVYPGHQMRFDMRNGFPVITERKITEKMFRGALGEVIGFAHGATTLDELESFGCPKKWWEDWTSIKHTTGVDGTPKFDLPQMNGQHLGELSYGGIWGRYPSVYGGEINQWKNLIIMMERNPGAFTHRVTNWHPDILTPDHKRKVVVAPCHGDVQILLFPETQELILHQTQRSGDVPVGVVFNMIEYAGIGMMLAHVLGYKFVEYVHELVNAHIYEMQIPFVEKLLSEPQRPLPKVELTFPRTGNAVNDFFAIRPTDFVLTEYESGSLMNIPTPL